MNEKVKVTSKIRAINDVNDDVVTDPLLICEQFNEWFFKVFRVEQCVMPEFHKLFPDCEILTFDPIMVSDMPQSLNPHKSQGLDNIHPLTLKKCTLSLAMPICLLFQRSLNLGMVPLLGDFQNSIWITLARARFLDH